MSTQPDSLELNAYVDGELDLRRQLEVEASLRADAALRAQVERALELRAALRSHADYHEAPAALRARIGQGIAAEFPGAGATAKSAQRPTGSTVVHRWFGWQSLVSALGGAAALAIALGFTLPPVQREAQLEREVVASHARATLAQHLVDVDSSDHHTVKPWLSSRLDFSPPVPQLAATQMLGGRVDYLDGRPVAALVYRRAGHLVDAFAWPTAQGDAGVVLSSQRGFQLAHWTARGMTHWVVSDLNPQEFSQLVRELNNAD